MNGNYARFAERDLSQLHRRLFQGIWSRQQVLPHSTSDIREQLRDPSFLVDGKDIDESRLESQPLSNAFNRGRFGAKDQAVVAFAQVSAFDGAAIPHALERQSIGKA